MSEPTALAGGPRVDVRRATEADTDALSRTLAAAFHGDPVFGWCIRDAGDRERHLPGWFRLVVGALLAHEETWCTDDAAGAALWVPAGTAPTTEEQDAALGGAIAAVGAAELARFEALGGVMDAHHPTEPHLYLWFAGVAPGHQGRGLGGRLLAARLARADAESQPAYLEATSERNRALYARHGFEVVGELRVDDSPPLWRMWREPT